MPNELFDTDPGQWTDAIDALGVLAHRYPFLLIDRLRVVEPGRRAFGLKRVTGRDWFGAASIDQVREMPGLLVVEALAQTSAGVLLGLIESAAGAIGYFASANRVRFRALPRAGDTLLCSVELVWFRRGVARLKGIATVDGRLATSAEFTAVIQGKAA